MFSSLTTEEVDRSSEQRIALVDPEPRQTLVDALTDAGYTVKSYHHPLEALEDIVDNPVKLAVVAPDLPWMPGSALARTLRESYRVSQVVLLEKTMSDDNIMAKVRSSAPIEEEPSKPRSRNRRPAAAPATTGRTGRRILVRSARPR